MPRGCCQIRGFALLLAGAILVACGGQTESSIDVDIQVEVSTSGPTATATQSPEASPTATPTPTPIPTVTPTPTPAVAISDTTVPQGGVFLLSLRNAAAATATVSFADRRYPMLKEGDTWWVVIGVPANLAPTEHLLRVQLQTLSGTPASPIILSVVVAEGSFVVEDIELLPDRTDLLDPALFAEERRILDSVLGTVTPRRLWSGPFRLPTAGEFSDPFGTRRSFNGGPVTSYHTGTDIAADEGTPVVAANRGVVAYAGPLPIRGNAVIIDHGGGVFSSYNHLASVQVTQGQTVAVGEAIGAVGSTGLSTGPHLHWEMIVHGTYVDPLPWTQRELQP